MTDAGLLKTDVFQTVQRLVGTHATVFSGVTPNPIEQDVESATEAYHNGKCDAVVALGGGSALDVGKVIRLRIKQPEMRLAHFAGQDPGPLAPLIAIPTTAGTGSEVGRSTVLVIDGTKTVIFSPYLMAKAAILDPELTVGLPPFITAATGMDALTHNLEAYVAKGDHPLADAIAIDGLRRIAANLKRAVQNGKDIEAREQMLLASAFGAIAFQKGLGACHSVAHALTPVAGVHHPISVVRMAVEDAYGAKQWREGAAGAPDEVAFRTERITRSTCRAVSEYAFRTAARMNARVYGGPKWTVSPVYEGMLKEEMDAAAARHPNVAYQPVLIDATYAGLLSGATDAPLVIPALNRDGDCLSDLVLPMYGSIAGAESILLAFDDDYNTTVAMAEAPHGTAPALQGKDVANPLAMILACGALLRQAAERAEAGSRPERAASATDRVAAGATERAARAIYEAALETVGAGTKTPDLGGHAGTTEFTDGVIERVRNKLQVWSSLGSAA